MVIATINRMILYFDKAFRALSVNVPRVEVARMALLVHEAMDAKTRAFHTTKHAFALCEGMTPIQVLAALFHDVVYYQLDAGYSTRIAALLEGVTGIQNETLRLLQTKHEDKATALCADIFGFCPGQVLRLDRGLNEFLSAVVATRLLQRHLTDAHLLAMVACIELTIPFRAPDASGQSAANALAQRIQTRSLKHHQALSISAHETAAFVKTIMMNALTFANRDVAGFTEADPQQCLSITLLLVEESLTSLTALGVCSLQAYRDALLRMEVFLNSLNPAFVCQSYDGYPDANTLLAMCAAAKRNIEFSRDYLGAMLATLAIIEALPLNTASDCPRAMLFRTTRNFFGEVDPGEGFGLEPLLHHPTHAELFRVLEKGCLLESSKVLTASPLTAFVYGFLGHSGTLETLQQAKRMFDGNLSPHAFLKTLDRDMLHTLITACAKTAESRKQALLALQQKLHASSELAINCGTTVIGKAKPGNDPAVQVFLDMKQNR